MSARVAAGLVVAAALAVGCGTAAEVADAPPPREDAAPATRTPVEISNRGGAWTADPRWTDRVREFEDASAAAATWLGPDTGLAFHERRGPVVVFDEAAPADGDVAPRFVDGVRRPVIRVQPRALLAGEFRADADLAPLVLAGAIAAGAGDREPPAWMLHGIALVASGEFDSALRRRALSGDTLKVREEDLFGAAATDRLAAAARAKALARCSRSVHPFARVLDAVFRGRTEEAALAEVGIGSLAFLDAASGTERARAAEALAGDPLVPALRAARTALATGDIERADAALGPVGARLDEPSLDPWLVADARLCLAEIALLRGDTRNANASLDAALASSKVARVQQARILEASLAPPERREALLAALRADWPDLKLR
jgi:hypothetical protein